jgi:PAS domain-containing protein
MRAEQQLRTSLKEIDDFKAAVDEHAIVAITDPQGKITYVNGKFCAISMRSRKIVGLCSGVVLSRPAAFAT